MRRSKSQQKLKDAGNESVCVCVWEGVCGVVTAQIGEFHISNDFAKPKSVTVE